MGERGPEGYALKYHGSENERKGIKDMPERRETLMRIDKSEVKSIETKADGSIVVTDNAGNMKVIGKAYERNPVEIYERNSVKMKVCIPDEKARLINGRNKVDLKPEDLEVCGKDATKLLEDYFGK